jgi:hypothetical protein
MSMRTRLLHTDKRSTGRAVLRRRLIFEELETRQMLAAAALLAPAAPANGTPTPTPVVAPSVIGAAVAFTSSVLTPTSNAPLIGSSITSNSSVLNPPGATQLSVILAFGEDALTATDVPDAAMPATISTTAMPWTPNFGAVVPLGQSLGGVVTRTESLEQGELGNLNRLGRASHGTVLAGVPAGQRDQSAPDDNGTRRADEDSFNSFTDVRVEVDSPQLFDVAIRELTAHDAKVTNDLKHLAKLHS